MASTTYAYLSSKVSEIRDRMSANLNRKSTAYNNIDAAVDDLGNMGPDYVGVSTEINSQAAANPSDEAWQALKASKDLLLSEFQTQEQDVQSVQTAMEPFRPGI